MKALCKKEAKPGIWMIHDAPMPEIGPNDVLIKIRKTSICGTDIHIYKWDEWSQKNVPVPLITGHEWMGEVVKTGSEVRNLAVGQRVSGEGHLTCGTCRNCRAGKQHLCIHTKGVGVHVQGAFAEYFRLPASNIFPLSDDVPDDIAAFFDPLGNAVHTALSFDLVGEDVLITGGGPIGCMAAAICRFAGARHVVVTDINPYRLELAKKMGATRAVNVSKTELKATMKELGMTEGFDVGLEMSGVAVAIRQMFDLVRHGGKVAMLGIPPKELAIDWNQVIFKGLFIKGIYGREMYETWYKMNAMIQSGLDMTPMITHSFKADDYEKAFEVMASGESGKVILDWT
ncbi:MAG TPA: L-threonine 3-dehydrogenase [Patescibacteria group bacterium]|nr:L-threonine 3-dehydrogenase [Patescibacteria group bacterium]